MALIVASVPELTMRSISIEGTAFWISSAIITSFSVGAPKVSPFSAASCTAFITGPKPWPRIPGPQEQT